MDKYINSNGIIHSAGEKVICGTDHSYRYGDGLFETMKVQGGKILFEEYHFERLFSGLKLLQVEIPVAFTDQKIRDEIAGLCKENNCTGLARVRLSISRGAGGVYDCDNKFSYLLECWPLEYKKPVGDAGLVIDIFPEVRKSTDIFSNLKSSNYLPYVMAAVWAKKNKLDDALVLNHHNRVCDATIANVFWIKEDRIFTPPLSEGCIAGVMRRIMLDHNSFGVKESVLTEDILFNADEVFLTNVITGIRRVKQIRNKLYQSGITTKISNELAKINSF